jgi:hypothetical protein
MADQKPSAFPVATKPLAPADLVPVIQGGANKIAQVSDLGGVVTATSPDNSLSISGSPGNNLALAVAAAFAGALNIVPGTYTYATLPPAASYANKYAATNDKGPVYSNGAFWEILFNPTQGSIAISTNSPLTPAAQGVAYSVTLGVTAGIAPFTWSLVSQFSSTNTWALSSGGVLTGTPANAETVYLMVQVSDSTGAVVQKLLSLQVVAAVTPAATPTFSPVAGTYTGPQTVAIACASGSPTIYYTTNGSTPTTGSTVYTAPLPVSSTQVLKAIATAPGFTQSAVGSASYVIGVNPIGINFAADLMSVQDFPIFQDQIRSSRGFTKAAALSTYANLGPNGWPTEDFGVVLHELAGGTVQSWQIAGAPAAVASASQTVANPGVFTTAAQTFAAGQPVQITGVAPGGFALNTNYYVIAAGLDGTHCQLSATKGGAGIQCTSSAACTILPVGMFACGFTGVGTVAANNGCTILNIVIGGSGASQTTTFDLLPDAAQATYTFKVTAVTPGVEVPNIFAYLPAYRASQANGGNVNGYSPTSLFTTESVTHYKQFGWLRDMKYKYAWTNSTANTSTTRRTPTNTKCFQNFVATSSDGFALDWLIDFLIALKAAGGNTGIWHCLPVNDDGTYLAADIVSLQRLSAGVPIYIEIGNELWNGTGSAGSALRALSVAVTPEASFTGTISGTTLTVSGVTGTIIAGGADVAFGAGVAPNTTIQSGSGTTWAVTPSQTVGPVAMTEGTLFSVYRMVAYLFHTNIAPALRNAFGGRFGTDVQTVLATQQGGGNGTFFVYKALSYAVAQGWNVGADIHWLAVAPYLNTQGLTPGTATIGQIEASLTSGAGNSVANIASTVGAEKLLTQARYYGLKGLLGYEGGWQVNSENSGMVNAGATVMDAGITPVISGLCSTIFDSGFSGHTHFESGVQGGTGNLGCNDHLSNNFATLIASGSPTLSGLQTYMPGTYAPTRNVVSTHGSTFPAYNYTGYSGPTAPVFTVTGAAPPDFINSFGTFTYSVDCTVAGIYSLAIDFTNTAAAAANMNVRLDGTTVLTGSGVVPGSGTNGGVNTVTLVSLNLSKGFHELTVGPGVSLATLSMTNLFRFN